jgi:hypothetical protein
MELRYMQTELSRDQIRLSMITGVTYSLHIVSSPPRMRVLCSQVS